MRQYLYIYFMVLATSYLLVSFVTWDILWVRKLPYLRWDHRLMIVALVILLILLVSLWLDTKRASRKVDQEHQSS